MDALQERVLPWDHGATHPGRHVNYTNPRRGSQCFSCREARKLRNAKLKRRVSFQEEETGVQSFTSRTEIAPESSPDSTVGSDARSVRSNGRLGLADRVVRKHQKNYLQARLHVVTFLESNGFKEIDVNCKKSKSFGLIRTYPLHEATKQENAYMVFWLLYLGADPFLKDSSGRTAIDYVNPLTTDPQVIRVFQNLHIQRQFQRIWPPPGLDDLLLERQIDPANLDSRRARRTV